MIDNETRDAVAKLASEVRRIIREFAKLHLGVEGKPAERIKSAGEAAEALSVEIPSEFRVWRLAEVQMIGGLEELGKLDLPTGLSIRVSAAWALYKEDMRRRKKAATITRSWSIEDEINAPGDDSVN